jgi:hypothetical protein
MLVVSELFAIYAILWGLAPYESINFPARLLLDSLDWPIDNLSTPLDQNTMLLSSIGAGLLGSVAVFFAGIVAPAIRDGNQSVIRVTVVAILVWYVIDGAGSIASGVVSNVVFNTVYLLLVLIPLLWKDSAEDEISTIKTAKTKSVSSAKN